MTWHAEHAAACPYPRIPTDVVSVERNPVDANAASSWPDLRSRMRGFLVGYALGDAAARAKDAAVGPLRVGAAGALALAGSEGVIRGLVRQELKGIGGGIPGCMWHSTARWAQRSDLGHLAGVVRWKGSAWPGQQWPDGWLSQVPVLRGPRGSAPAIEAALAVDSAHAVPMVPPDTGSTGDMVIARVLPLAMLVATATPITRAPGRTDLDENFAQDLVDTAVAAAAYSHGLFAQVVAVALTRTAAQVLATGSLTGLVDLDRVCDSFGERGGTSDVSRAREALERVNSALRQGTGHPAVGGPRTALRAAEAGLADAHELRPQDPNQLAGALKAVARRREPGAAAITMALLGSVHGFEALPVGAVARLDVAHLADQLAQDLMTQAGSSISLSAAASGAPNAWVDRYPGC